MKIISLIATVAIALFLYTKIKEPASSNTSQQTPSSNSQVKKPVTILALGDSLTEGYNIAQKDSYPNLLENALNQEFENLDIKVVNAGISGSTSSSALSRLQGHIENLKKIDVLILALGSNDGLRGIPIETIQLNLERTIAVAKIHNIKVFLAGMKLPPSYGLSYQSRFNKIFKTIAKNHKTEFIPFLLKDVAAKPHLNLPDGIHPNEKGHQVIAQNILPFFTEFLNDRN